MSRALVLTDDALVDLDELHAWIAVDSGLIRADRVIDGIRETLSKQRNFSNRGEHPPELLALGIQEYRQVHYKPYRMIYRVLDTTVAVMLITDGRRDMQSLLQRRLLA